MHNLEVKYQKKKFKVKRKSSLLIEQPFKVRTIQSTHYEPQNIAKPKPYNIRYFKN